MRSQSITAKLLSVTSNGLLVSFCCRDKILVYSSLITIESISKMARAQGNLGVAFTLGSKKHILYIPSITNS